MIKKSYVNGHAVTTYKIGNVYETIILNKYGTQLKARVDFTIEQARATHSLFYGLCM